MTADLPSSFLIFSRSRGSPDCEGEMSFLFRNSIYALCSTISKPRSRSPVSVAATIARFRWVSGRSFISTKTRAFIILVVDLGTGHDILRPEVRRHRADGQ
jgi:hypothetical protein